MPEVVVVGSFMQDLAFRTKAFPKPGETRIGSFATHAGGKGFNQAVACSRLGTDTLFVGALGEDAFAETAKRFASDEGFATHFQICPKASTGVASLTINATGENMILVDLGANAELLIETVEALKNEIASASVVLCQLESNLDATRRALTLGREFEVTTILNPAPINESITRDLISLADIVTPNETEFTYLYEKFNDKTLSASFWQASDAEVHELCRNIGAGVVILTLGGEGCFISTENSYKRFLAMQVEPVDTTGAGDAFNGGLATGLHRFKNDLYQSVEYAIRVAALSVEKEGTAPSMPNSDAVSNRFPNIQYNQ